MTLNFIWHKLFFVYVSMIYVVVERLRFGNVAQSSVLRASSVFTCSVAVEVRCISFRSLFVVWMPRTVQTSTDRARLKHGKRKGQFVKSKVANARENQVKAVRQAHKRRKVSNTLTNLVNKTFFSWAAFSTWKNVQYDLLTNLYFILLHKYNFTHTIFLNFRNKIHHQLRTICQTKFGLLIWILWQNIYGARRVTFPYH